MFTKIYMGLWALWAVTGLVAIATGWMAGFPLIIFGMITFGLIYFGMMFVLPVSITHSNELTEHSEDWVTSPKADHSKQRVYGVSVPRHV
ncbi:hypothetical protein [Leptolyngbya sp. 7M]|uniref:hypothetical protein n=1 Tax=Leptolyngbya sp. 7M TaxID=2812896 RepID=UPI001B8D05DF|nr:hypothetical protein [Leptolyngbya sp. 7M]QYO65465.1 hypothetical protein JVX88_01365 [Leptolyngbya sp. 7M]QYU68356.1 hypothetical protein J4558_26710 [Leptolyngbya sp. 15MV]